MRGLLTGRRGGPSLPIPPRTPTVITPYVLEASRDVVCENDISAYLYPALLDRQPGLAHPLSPALGQGSLLRLRLLTKDASTAANKRQKDLCCKG
jgi:hypothetical protein